MSDNNKDRHQTGWIVPPTAPFGGSQFDHKIKADVLEAYLKSKKREASREPQKPI